MILVSYVFSVKILSNKNCKTFFKMQDCAFSCVIWGGGGSLSLSGIAQSQLPSFASELQCLFGAVPINFFVLNACLKYLSAMLNWGVALIQVNMVQSYCVSKTKLKTKIVKHTSKVEHHDTHIITDPLDSFFLLRFGITINLQSVTILFACFTQ